MKAGFCEKDITPAPGTERAGGYYKMFIQGVHDPLKVRASVFDNGKNRVAIIGVDTCIITAKTVNAVKALIKEKIGIVPENVMIAASHTHAGGSLWGGDMEKYVDAPELIKKLVFDCSSSIDKDYEPLVAEKIVEAVEEAELALAESSFSFGTGCENSAVFNRRIRMKNGAAFTHPGKGNPDIVDYAGPTDPDVGVIGVWDDACKLRGCIVNYACHCTTHSGVNASADWVCAMERVIRGKFGNEVVVVFLNGACGDVTQVDNIGMRKNHSGEEWMDLVGGRVGAEAVKVLISSEKGNADKLESSMKTLKIKRRIPDKAKVLEARKKIELELDDESKRSKSDFIWAKERLVADYLAGAEPERDVILQAVQIGAAAILANPAEYFCQFGLDIKKGSPFKYTFVVELANDCVGYVPTEDAFSESGGGYETRLTSYSNLVPEAGKMIADASIEMAKKYTPEEEPSGPEAEPFRASWDYGNNKPELD